MNHKIRLASILDSEEILNIYAPYVSDTTISFEIVVPSLSEFSLRVESICKTYPYLVYKIGGKVVGFAYASRHRERAAYLYDVDTSIYIVPEFQGGGIAYKLYECLFRLLKELGYYNAYAAYTVPNENSKKFHEKFGFSYIGTHSKTGFKFGKWIDLVWLEKIIMEHNENPKKIKLISELKEEYLNELFYSIIGM